MPRSSAFAIYQPEIKVPFATVPQSAQTVGYGEDLAGDIGAELGAADKKLRFAAQAWQANALAELRLNHQMRIDSTSDDDIDAGFVPSVEQDFDRDVAAYEKARPGYATGFGDGAAVVRQDLAAQAKARADSAATKRSESALSESVGKINQAATLDGANVYELHNEATAMVRSGKLSPDKAAVLLDEIAKIPRRFIASQARRDPRKALEIVDGKAWNKFFTDLRETAHLRAGIKAEIARQRTLDNGRKAADALFAQSQVHGALERMGKGEASFFDLPDPASLETAGGSKTARAYREQADAARAAAARLAKEMDAAADVILGGRDIDPGFAAEGLPRGEDIDPGFTKGAEGLPGPEIDPGFTKGTEGLGKRPEPAFVRGADALWEKIAPHLEGRPWEETPNVVARFIMRAGMVPRGLRREISRAIKTGTAEGIAQAVGMLEKVDLRRGRLTEFFDPGDLDAIGAVKALTASGVALDQAAKIYLEGRETTDDTMARRIGAFGRLIDSKGLMDALARAFETPGDVRLQPGEGHAGPFPIDEDPTTSNFRTLPFDPDEDGAPWRTLEMQEGEATSYGQFESTAASQAGPGSKKTAADRTPQSPYLPPVDVSELREDPPIRFERDFAQFPESAPELNGTVCTRGKCESARDRNETDRKMPVPVRLFELRIIKKMFGPKATREWMKRNKRNYHAYHNTTHFRAPGVTLTQLREKLRLWAAPQVSYERPQRDRPVVSGDESELWIGHDTIFPGLDVRDSLGVNVPLPGGTVTHYYDEDSGVLVNVTQPNHRLHPGYILRWIEQSPDGTFVVHTVGRGLGFNARINEQSGPRMFTQVDDAIIRDVGGRVLN